MTGDDEADANPDDVLRFRAKRELRKRLRALRAALPARAIRERSDALVKNVLSLDAWSSARTVALFSALSDEVQTDGLIAAARDAGKRVALPVVVEDSPRLIFRAPWDGGVDRALSTASFGLSEPGPDAPEVALDTIDLWVLPALAIDPRGHRIGYGRGYYDHTLMHASQRAVKVAVAFEFQLIAEVPVRRDDIAADWVVTDKRVLAAER